jgi:hypothetical protein
MFLFVWDADTFFLDFRLYPKRKIGHLKGGFLQDLIILLGQLGFMRELIIFVFTFYSFRRLLSLLSFNDNSIFCI